VQLLGLRLQRAHDELRIPSLSAGLNVISGEPENVQHVRQFLGGVLRDLAGESFTNHANFEHPEHAGEVTVQNHTGRFVVRRHARHHHSQPYAGYSLPPSGLPEVRRQMGESNSLGLGRIFAGDHRDTELSFEDILAAGLSHDDSGRNFGASQQVAELERELAAVRHELANLGLTDDQIPQDVAPGPWAESISAEIVGAWQQRLREVSSQLRSIEVRHHELPSRRTFTRLEADIPLHVDPTENNPDFRRVESELHNLREFIRAANLTGSCPHCQWEALQSQLASRLDALHRSLLALRTAGIEDSKRRVSEWERARQIQDCDERLRDLHDELGAHLDGAGRVPPLSRGELRQNFANDLQVASHSHQPICHHQRGEFLDGSNRRRQLLVREQSLVDVLQRLLATPRQPALLRLAEPLVMHLSAGRIVGLQQTSRGVLATVGRHGERTDARSLALEDAAAVRLGMTLALARQSHARGLRHPLLLDDTHSGLRYVDPHRLADVLAGAESHGVQTVVCTSNELLSQALAQRGARAHSLGYANSHVATPTTYTAVPAHETVARPSAFGPGWDGEEFPGELLDRSKETSRYDSPHAVRENGRFYATSQNEAVSGAPSTRAEREISSSGDGEGLRYRSDRAHRDGEPTAHRRRRSRRSDSQARLHDNSDRQERQSKPRRAVRRLESHHPLADAPSIGPRLAERFSLAGVHTIADFVGQNTAELAGRLKLRRVTADVLRQWQQQALLAVRIPELRGRDALMLVASGVPDPENLARQTPSELFARVSAVANQQEGRRILRDADAPTLQDVTDWITWAGSARTLGAA
jgi:hypothetical protein